VWYPGSEPGGGSYIAQRMLASKSEKDALAGTLFFNVAHYALRSWPWIIVALASMLVFPSLDDIAYPAMLTFLPAGFAGLMVAGLLAAYVSTMVTHLNWGSSYLVHDLYRRFIKPGGSEKHYVMTGRLVTACLMLAAAGLTYVLDTASEGFQLLLSIGAGTGLLYLLRWFWWRVNAWSEISAMISSFLVGVGFLVARKSGFVIADHVSLLITVGVTSVAWIATTLMTRPTDDATLLRFFALVRPAGRGWAPIAAKSNVAGATDSLPQALLGWMLGCAFVYSALFGTGSFIYGRMPQFAMWLVVFVVSGLGVRRVLQGFWASSASDAAAPSASASGS